MVAQLVGQKLSGREGWSYIRGIHSTLHTSKGEKKMLEKNQEEKYKKLEFWGLVAAANKSCVSRKSIFTPLLSFYGGRQKMGEEGGGGGRLKIHV